MDGAKGVNKSFKTGQNDMVKVFFQNLFLDNDIPH